MSSHDIWPIEILGPELPLRLHRGGWFRVEQPDDVVVYGQAELAGQRVVVSALLVQTTADAGRAELRTDDLKGLRLGAIQQFLNSPEVLPYVRSSLATVDASGLTAALLALAMERPRHQERLLDADLRLNVPAGRKPDDFYEEVARVFAAAGLRVRGPAAAIAEANNVPTTTVHRWLKEAKRRGLMAASAPRQQSSQSQSPKKGSS